MEAGGGDGASRFADDAFLPVFAFVRGLIAKSLGFDGDFPDCPGSGNPLLVLCGTDGRGRREDNVDGEPGSRTPVISDFEYR